MKLAIGIVSLLACTLVLGCVTNDDPDVTWTKDDFGRKTSFGQWREIDPRNVMINIVDLENFPPLEIVQVHQSTRDNQVPKQLVRFDRDRATLEVDHAADGWFKLASTDKIRSVSTNKERLEDWWRRSDEGREAGSRDASWEAYKRSAYASAGGKQAGTVKLAKTLGMTVEEFKASEAAKTGNIGWLESRKISRGQSRGGWVHSALVGVSQKDCIFGYMGFLSRNGVSPDGSTGDVYNTLVSVRDCSGKRTLKDYVKFFNGVKLVSSGYNR